ncbi:phenylalanyl-trnasynthetase alpha related protein [Cyclospora cayetanensis]|uniref:Phenylalanyl-trnasynthetase alpha related protein n=1 Tax=Cyclospora cayetanensis TaxID=88456 RepID=A0A1D3D8F0_9EIME|nr:phenylalanyl-trnasynthetase alpha related protein [Cyclospora cayetanensis]
MGLSPTSWPPRAPLELTAHAVNIICYRGLRAPASVWRTARSVETPLVTTRSPRVVRREAPAIPAIGVVAGNNEANINGKRKQSGSHRALHFSLPPCSPANIESIKSGACKTFRAGASTASGAVASVLSVAHDSSPTAPAGSVSETAQLAAAGEEEGPSYLELLWRFPPKPPHIPQTVWRGLLRGLHLRPDTPVGITTRLVELFFTRGGTAAAFSPEYPKPECTNGYQSQHEQQPHERQKESPAYALDAQLSKAEMASFGRFAYLDRLSPLVSTVENFDSLLIDPTHCSRSTSDTYYLDPNFSLTHAQLDALARQQDDAASNNILASSSRMVLRTHGTAHQAFVLGSGMRRAIWCGAVARRDQVDSTHYPVFHQVDGISVFEPLHTTSKDLETATACLDTLKRQHTALLHAIDLVRKMQSQQHQDAAGGQEEGLGSAAAAAAGLSVHAVRNLCSFACLSEENPYRSNPIVLQLQVTLEKLVRFLWAHKPHAAPGAMPNSTNATTDGHANSNARSTELKLRWVYDAYFPFTSPSLELEVLHEGLWLEVLGAGEIKPQIIATACSQQHQQQKQGQLRHELPFHPEARGWAFGLGIERVAMVLFSVDDIRILWSTDHRFTQQFTEGRVKTFVAFSHMPPVFKDISFWLPKKKAPTESFQGSSSDLAATVSQTDGPSSGQGPPICPASFDLSRFYEVCREEGGSLIESVALQDAFTHPKTGRQSLCFRITYKALDRTLTHAEVNALQEKLITKLQQIFEIELR